jgi:hypothetical protein
MNTLDELIQRVDEYRTHSAKAEQMALQKLALYPPFDRPLTAIDVLRRELLRHHTRTVMLDEMRQWITELQGMRLYQLCLLPEFGQSEPETYHVQQYMTAEEAVEVNATFEANHERLRWMLVETSEPPA